MAAHSFNLLPGVTGVHLDVEVNAHLDRSYRALSGDPVSRAAI
jgi:hypothetical protein